MTLKSRNAHCARSSGAKFADLCAFGIAALVLTGCTASQPYWHHRLAEDRFSVSYGNRADLCALLYSAELTLAAGYSHFFASRGRAPVGHTTYNPPPMPLCGQTPFVGACSSGSYSYWETSSSYEIHLLQRMPDSDEAGEIVRHLGIPYEDMFVYNASEVRRSLRPDDSIECSIDLPISLEPISP